MIKHILLLSLLTISYSIQVKINSCTCEDVNYKLECENYQPDGRFVCNWNSENGSCESTLAVDCSLIQDNEVCRSQTYCGWVEKKCVDFDKCSDYDDTLSQKCESINRSCIVGPNSCVDKTQCEFQTAKECKSSLHNKCFIDSFPEKCKTLNSCKEARQEENCYINSQVCIWNYDSCDLKKCSDILEKKSCLYVKSFDQQYATLCRWTSDEKCVEGIPLYTAYNCFTNSAYSKVWEENGCQTCYGGINLFLEIAILISLLII